MYVSIQIQYSYLYSITSIWFTSSPTSKNHKDNIVEFW
jgi:hypothetical protein